MKIHSPSLVITVNDLPSPVLEALQLARIQAACNATVVQIPRSSFPHALWMAAVPPASLPCTVILTWKSKLFEFNLDGSCELNITFLSSFLNTLGIQILFVHNLELMLRVWLILELFISFHPILCGRVYMWANCMPSYGIKCLKVS